MVYVVPVLFKKVKCCHEGEYFMCITDLTNVFLLISLPTDVYPFFLAPILLL
uniref:Uncharacterized protein n=1 Tax=Nymphaea colorata TaxID=210225 RepID=A0A5K1DWT5_9MAGN